MSLFTVFNIASAGMTAQRERLEAATSNMANSNTTRTAEGGPYRRRDVIFESVAAQVPNSGFTSDLFQVPALESGQEQPQGVRSTMTVAQAGVGVRQYQPGHPDADADGYVAMPDVDPLEETVNMLSAARSFEANATAFNTAKELARATLKLGDA
jgi:flagellar basal-body rod protein FlgC